MVYLFGDWSDDETRPVYSTVIDPPSEANPDHLRPRIEARSFKPIKLGYGSNPAFHTAVTSAWSKIIYPFNVPCE
jgi:hypothetical protein